MSRSPWHRGRPIVLALPLMFLLGCTGTVGPSQTPGPLAFATDCPSTIGAGGTPMLVGDTSVSVPGGWDATTAPVPRLPGVSTLGAGSPDGELHLIVVLDTSAAPSAVNDPSFEILGSSEVSLADGNLRPAEFVRENEGIGYLVTAHTAAGLVAIHALATSGACGASLADMLRRVRLGS